PRRPLDLRRLLAKSFSLSFSHRPRSQRHGAPSSSGGHARASRTEAPVTIRAAGSSLSGQSQGDGILLEARRHWAGWNIEDQGRRLRVRPGTVMFRANLALAAYGYRLGPDPASGSVCTVGGVIANNASGMCCGTAQNSYKTIDSLTFLLAS